MTTNPTTTSLIADPVQRPLQPSNHTKMESILTSNNPNQSPCAQHQPTTTTSRRPPPTANAEPDSIELARPSSPRTPGRDPSGRWSLCCPQHYLDCRPGRSKVGKRRIFPPSPMFACQSNSTTTSTGRTIGLIGVCAVGALCIPRATPGLIPGRLPNKFSVTACDVAVLSEEGGARSGPRC